MMALWGPGGATSCALSGSSSAAKAFTERLGWPRCQIKEWRRTTYAADLRQTDDILGTAFHRIVYAAETEISMPRKYSRSASSDVKREMHRYKRAEAKSGK